MKKEWIYWGKLFLHLSMAGIVFPGYLLFIDIYEGGMYWQHIVFWIVYGNVLWLLSPRKWLSLQIILGYMLPAAGFLFVVAGGTIPIQLMIVGLTGGLLVSQHIMIYQMYRYKWGKSLLFSSQVMTVFLGSSIIFGVVYIMNGTLEEQWLLLARVLLYVLIMGNTLRITFWLYRLSLSPMIGVLIFGLTCLMVTMRLLPLGHVTQALLITMIWVYSVSLIHGFFTTHDRYVNTALVHGIGIFLLTIGVLASELWPMI